jgi:NTP pyrophosphatase (non-canonical NTP hydrolase)
MDPIKFAQTNLTLVADGCRDLPAFEDKEQGRFVTCWEMSPEEREEFLKTGRIYITIVGKGHPPILPTVVNPVIDHPVKSNQERFEELVGRASVEYDFTFNLLRTSEECGELVQAICKRLSPYISELDGIKLNYDIVGELVDVKLCIEALLRRMNQSNISSATIAKLDRLEQRLNKRLEEAKK